MNTALIILCVIIIVLIALLIKFVLEYTKVIQEQITAYKKQLDSNTELISKDIVDVYNLISDKRLSLNNKLIDIFNKLDKTDNNITDIFEISDNVADKLYNITNGIKTVNDKVDELKTKKQAKNSSSNKSTINKSTKQ